MLPKYSKLKQKFQQPNKGLGLSPNIRVPCKFCGRSWIIINVFKWGVSRMLQSWDDFWTRIAFITFLQVSISSLMPLECRFWEKKTCPPWMRTSQLYGQKKDAEASCLRPTEEKDLPWWPKAQVWRSPVHINLLFKQPPHQGALEILFFAHIAKNIATPGNNAGNSMADLTEMQITEAKHTLRAVSQTTREIYRVWLQISTMRRLKNWRIFWEPLKNPPRQVHVHWRF